VIVAAAGESARLVTEAGAGITVPPADAEALAAAVRRLHGDPTLSGDLVEAGRAFAALHLREREVDRLQEILREAAF
jgi:glycosyltransferase involved in cell wall biosynthesis